MIFHGDALDHLDNCASYTCMIADIPDNIGLKYDGFVDKIPNYYGWVDNLITKALAKSDIFWLTYNHIHDWEISALVRKYKRPKRKIIWHYTFGQYQDSAFTNCYRPIIVFGDGLNYDGIRIPSSRMALGDTRAAGPKVPGDVWEFPRVVGNAAERRSWHPTQLPELLVTRMVILGAMRTEQGKTTPIGDCCDLFVGSGTSAIVCKALGVPFEGVDISYKYCEKVARILGKDCAIAPVERREAGKTEA